MQNSFHPTFKAFYDRLPLFIRNQADRAFAFFDVNHRHNSLQFKCLDKAAQQYSIRINQKGYRALGYKDGDTVIWDWIGPPDEYMRRIKGH